MSDPRGDTLYEYGDRAHLTKLTAPDNTYTEWSYNQNGQLSELRYPDGVRVRYLYNQANLPSAVQLDITSGGAWTSAAKTSVARHCDDMGFTRRLVG